MITLPSYWTTVAFTDPLGNIGWVKGPRNRTYEPTTRFKQTFTFSGPTETFNEFGNILCGDYGYKPFQLDAAQEGPNTVVTLTYYSDDADGVYPRDPLLTTFEMHPNMGNESVLWTKSTLFKFKDYPDVIRRIQVAVDLYNNSLGPLTNTYWQKATLTTNLDLMQLQTALFDDIVAKNLLSNSGAAATDCILWHANQLYRLILRGVTTVPRFEYVLRKTSIIFPRSRIGNVVIGSDISASYHRCGYLFSYKALVAAEPDLTKDTQVIVNYTTMPRFWWWKCPPIVAQTSDARWMLTQEYRAFETFEPALYPWVIADGETFTSSQFDPAVWYDSVRGITDGGSYKEQPPNRSATKPLGVRPNSGCPQWSKEMQNAIFGNQSGTIDL